MRYVSIPKVRPRRSVSNRATRFARSTAQAVDKLTRDSSRKMQALDAGRKGELESRRGSETAARSSRRWVACPRRCPASCRRRTMRSTPRPKAERPPVGRGDDQNARVRKRVPGLRARELRSAAGLWRGRLAARPGRIQGGGAASSPLEAAVRAARFDSAGAQGGGSRQAGNRPRLASSAACWTRW